MKLALILFPCAFLSQVFAAPTDSGAILGQEKREATTEKRDAIASTIPAVLSRATAAGVLSGAIGGASATTHSGEFAGGHGKRRQRKKRGTGQGEEDQGLGKESSLSDCTGSSCKDSTGDADLDAKADAIDDKDDESPEPDLKKREPAFAGVKAVKAVHTLFQAARPAAGRWLNRLTGRSEENSSSANTTPQSGLTKRQPLGPVVKGVAKGSVIAVGGFYMGSEVGHYGGRALHKGHETASEVVEKAIEKAGKQYRKRSISFFAGNAARTGQKMALLPLAAGASYGLPKAYREAREDSQMKKEMKHINTITSNDHLPRA